MLRDASLCDHRCKALLAMPPLSTLTNLRRLNLSHCDSMAELPEMGTLTALKEIVVDGCYGMKQKSGNGMYVLKPKARARLPTALKWDYSE